MSTHEQRTTDTYTEQSRQEEALKTIDYYRDAAEDRFDVRELDEEFAYFARELGGAGVFLANAADNAAGTFKWRGAMNRMARLKADGEESVLLPSAGNHLRGGVIAGKTLNMTVHGVVPTTAPHAKKQGARDLWTEQSRLHLHEVGRSFDEALAWTNAHNHLGTLVHPYDDPDVAAGQGTIADDIQRAFEQSGTQLDRVVVPVGGGGLLAGMARRFHQLNSNVTIDGVEAVGSDSLSRSAQHNAYESASAPNKKYGGSAVRNTGRHTLETYRDFDNVQLWQATDDEVSALANDYLVERNVRELERYPAFEPTTLVAVAGLRRIVEQHPNQNIVVVGTGVNDAPEAMWR